MTGSFVLGDRESEAAVLGAVVLSARALTPLIVDEALTPDDFASSKHQQIYTAMLALHDTGEPIDALTIARKAQLEPGRVEQLAAEVPAAGNVRHYARLVKRAALRRRWQAAGHLLAQAAAEDDEQLVAQAEAQLAAPTVTDDTSSREQLAAAVFGYLQDTRPVGISTGFHGLDEIIGGGLRPGDTTVIAAWESMGKSAMADQWLTGAATAGLRAHAYINEMSRTDRALRMVARHGAAPWSRLVRRTLRDGEHERVVAALSDLPFEVTDSSDWSAEQIARHIRVNRWDVCALDVLHNMAYDGENELRQIATALVKAARSTGAHLILVCHLNQERAKSETLPQPVMRDLRGSGMLAKLAANVLFLHREQSVRDDGFVETAEDGKLYAAKARHGRPGDGIDVEFEPQRMRFRLPSALEAAA